jgi:hypothetical protein
VCEVAYAQSRLSHGGTIRALAKLVVVLTDGHRDHAEAQRQLTVRELEASRTCKRMSPCERWLSHAGVSP